MDLSKEKYKCVVQSGLEGLILTDLFIKSAEGKSLRPVRLQKDQYLPLDLVDSAEAVKSRLSGSLGRSIKMGWMIVENSALPCDTKSVEAPKQPMTSATTITEVAAGIVRQDQLTSPISASKSLKESYPWPKDVDLPVVTLISDEDSKTHNALAITETSLLPKNK
jgi:hypothetical protein